MSSKKPSFLWEFLVLYDFLLFDFFFLFLFLPFQAKAFSKLECLLLYLFHEIERETTSSSLSSVTGFSSSVTCYNIFDWMKLRNEEWKGKKEKKKGKEKEKSENEQSFYFQLLHSILLPTIASVASNNEIQLFLQDILQRIDNILNNDNSNSVDDSNMLD
jgi:hypothetical protein